MWAVWEDDLNLSLYEVESFLQYNEIPPKCVLFNSSRPLVVTISRYLFCQCLYCDNQQVTHLTKLLYPDVVWRKQDTNGSLLEFMQACIINSNLWECRSKEKCPRWADWLPTGASHCVKNQLSFNFTPTTQLRVLPKMNRSHVASTENRQIAFVFWGFRIFCLVCAARS